MSRVWKPGDVAAVTWKCLGVTRTDRRIRANSAVVGDVWWGGDGWIGDATAKDARPLVVIDPEDREQVERLDAAYQQAIDKSPKYDGLGDVMQTALRSLIADPKPDEPQGLGAVVEDAEGEWFVRWKASGRANRHWKGEGDGDYRAWSTITAVRVLSEGVTPA